MRPLCATLPICLTLAACGPKLTGARLHGAGLARADLSHADLRGADLQHADLRAADLSHADLRHANLHGAVMLADRECMKMGSLPTCPRDGAVSHMCSPIHCRDFPPTAIGGARWEGATCPDGTGADAHGGTCEGHIDPRGAR